MAELVMTIEQMKDREAWLKLRNSGLGGSDAAVILGANPWKSRLALWAEKTGQLPPEDLSKNMRVYWGQKNEANIADWFEEETGSRAGHETPSAPDAEDPRGDGAPPQDV